MIGRAKSVEDICNLAFGASFKNKEAIHFADVFDFFLGTRNQYHPVGLEAFMLAYRARAGGFELEGRRVKKLNVRKTPIMLPADDQAPAEAVQ
jgi:hypothetical protein